VDTEASSHAPDGGPTVAGPGGVLYRIERPADRWTFLLAVLTELLVVMKHTRDLAGAKSSVGTRSVSVSRELRELEEKVRARPDLFASTPHQHASSYFTDNRQRQSSDGTTKSMVSIWVHEALVNIHQIEELDGLDDDMRADAIRLATELKHLARSVRSMHDHRKAPSESRFFVA